MQKDELEKLARLARIEVSDDDIEALSGDLDRIVNFVSEIQNAEVPEDLRMEAGDHINVMREDGEPHKKGVYTRELLDDAPDTEKGFVKVKKIL